MRTSTTIFSTILLIISILSKPGYTQAQQTKNNYYLVFLTPKTNNELTVEEIQVVENNHLRNIGRLSENNILANAGPFEGGGEIMLLALNSKHETEVLLKDDPLIHEGLASFEILSLEIRKGGICDPAIPYEMKTYSFVRYSPTNQVASYKTNSDFDMKRLHDRYLKELLASGDVVMEGILSGNDGGILIYKSSSKNINVGLDPAITQGYLVADIRTIWLNKGSFCDN